MELIGIIAAIIGFVASVIQLLDFWQKHQERRRLQNPPSSPSSLLARSPGFPLSSSRQDWGEAIAAPTFYGREAELNQLSAWIVDDYCRLIAQWSEAC
jgi:hypothetical protein